MLTLVILFFGLGAMASVAPMDHPRDIKKWWNAILIAISIIVLCVVSLFRHGR